MCRLMCLTARREGGEAAKAGEEKKLRAGSHSHPDPRKSVGPAPGPAPVGSDPETVFGNNRRYTLPPLPLTNPESPNHPNHFRKTELRDRNHFFRVLVFTREVDGGGRRWIWQLGRTKSSNKLIMSSFHRTREVKVRVRGDGGGTGAAPAASPRGTSTARRLGGRRFHVETNVFGCAVLTPYSRVGSVIMVAFPPVTSTARRRRLGRAIDRGGHAM